MSTLANASDPWSSSALPSCGSPASVTVTGASANFCGAISGNQWTITARGWTGNAQYGAGNVTRTITAVAVVQTFADGGLGATWNRIFVDDTSTTCTNLKKIVITVPFTTRGCVKMDGTPTDPSQLLGNPVIIGGTVDIKNTDSIGTPTSPVPQIDIAGWCKLEGGSQHTPCSAADHVYGTTITTTPSFLPRPTFDFAYWYANSKPGPLHDCTSGGLPGGKHFDKNTTYNDDNDKINLTPNNASYDCQYVEGGQVVGQLAWNYVTHVLTVKGSIFFDGDLEANDDAALVNYNGKATIFASGKLNEFKELWCAGGNGTNNCRSNISTWDPTQNLIIWVVGSKETGDSEVIKMKKDGGGFQGAIWGGRKCKFDDDIMISAPILCHKVAIKEDTDWASIWPWPASLISSVSGQVYGDPGGDWQIILTRQYG
jgi:hypothetical protein